MANLQEMQDFVATQLNQTGEFARIIQAPGWPEGTSRKEEPTHGYVSARKYNEMAGDGPMKYLIITEAAPYSPVDDFVRRIRGFSTEGIAVVPLLHMQHPKFFRQDKVAYRVQDGKTEDLGNAADFFSLERAIAELYGNNIYYFSNERRPHIHVVTISDEPIQARYNKNTSIRVPEYRNITHTLKRTRKIIDETALDGFTVEHMDKNGLLLARFVPYEHPKQGTLIETERPCYLMEADHLTPAGKKKRSRRK